MGKKKFEAKAQVATERTMVEVVEYMQRLAHAGKLRAIAVAYVDPDGRDYSLYAVQHLDVAGAAGIARGLAQLEQILEGDVV